MQNVLDEISNGAAALERSATNFTKSLSIFGEKISSWNSSSLPSLKGISNRLFALAHSVNSTINSEISRFELIPTTRFVLLRDQIQTCIAAVDNFQSFLENVNRYGGIRDFNRDGTIYTSSGNTLNISNPISEINSRLDGCLEAFFPFGMIGKGRAFINLSSAVDQIRDQVLSASIILEEAHLKKIRLGEISEQTALLLQRAKEVSTESSALMDSAKNSLAEITEMESRIVAAAARASELVVNTDLLNEKITLIQPKMDSFDALLSEREERIKQGSADVIQITQKFSDQQQTVTALIEKSEEMLGGATVAGLSTTFKDQVKEFDKRLGFAEAFFYAGCALTAFSVLAAFNVFQAFGINFPEIPVVTDQTRTGTAAIQLFSAISARIIVLLPALFILGFSSSRFNKLFRLREEYCHKYTMAASVQGFKIQAPSYQEAVAAAVFKELLSNPSSAVVRSFEDVRTGNGFLDRLILPRVKKALDEWETLRDSTQNDKN